MRMHTMWLLRSLFLAVLQRIVVLANFDSSSNEHLVAPEGHACHAQLMITCYYFSSLLEHGSNYSNTVIGFLPGNYSLSQQWVIANASNLTLMARVDHRNEEQWSQHSGAVFDCEEDAGLIVILSDDIYINGFTFTGCGTYYNSSSGSLVSSLSIIETSNITLNMTSIRNGTGIGMWLENSGDFAITNCSFISNARDGLYVRYSDESVVRTASTKYSGRVDGSLFAFNGLGGLVLWFEQSEFLVEVIVSDSNFYTTDPDSTHIRVRSWSCLYTIEFTNFLTVGSEFAFTLFSYPQECEVSESIPMVRLQRGELQNLSCGVVYIAWLESVHELLILDSIHIHDIDGDYVVGVHVTQILDPINACVGGLTIYGKNLTFWDVHGSEGTAVVAMNSVQNITYSDVSVLNNTAGPGLHLVDSNVYIMGDNLFYNNFALVGGAIGLYSSSLIVLLSPAKVNFTLNRADTLGRAIYISSEIGVQGTYCSFQQGSSASPNEITLFFSGNEAGVGSAIYGEDISNCFSWLLGGKYGQASQLDSIYHQTVEAQTSLPVQDKCIFAEKFAPRSRKMNCKTFLVSPFLSLL